MIQTPCEVEGSTKEALPMNEQKEISPSLDLCDTGYITFDTMGYVVI